MMKWRERLETITADEKAYTLSTRTSNIHIESTHNLHRLKIPQSPRPRAHVVMATAMPAECASSLREVLRLPEQK